VLGPCYNRICKERLPIRWLWVHSIAEPLDYIWCNTQMHWHSVDTRLTLCWCSVDALLTLCWRSVDALLMFCWRSVDALLTLCWRSVDTLLTLCWRSFGGVAVSTHTILPEKAANTSIMDQCRSTAFGLHKIQSTKSLTLCWRSLSDSGSDHVVIAFAQNRCQYIDYGYMLLRSAWILHDGTPKIIDTLLTICWRCVDALLTICWHSVDAHFEV